MKKILSLFTAAVLSSAVFMTACEKQRSSGANYSFDYAMVGHPVSLDPQFANDKCSLEVIGNLYTGLLEMNNDGTLKKAAAEDYTVSSDGLVYNFKLRKNCYWFIDENKDEEVSDDECFSVTAHDFEFAFKRIFNPETCSPHRETYRCLKNAEGIINGSADYNTIGVHALSDTELVFELDYPSTDFLNSLTFTPAMPCNEKFFYETKGRYGLDDQSVMSNGAFFIRQWFYDKYGNDNFVYMQRNLANNDYDTIYPTALNFYMKDTYADAQTAFENGESDVLMSFLCSDKLKEENNIETYTNYTIGIIANPSNSKYGNKSIRKALAYGIDKEAFEGQISEDLSKAYGIIAPDICTDGNKYRKLNPDKLASILLHDKSNIEYNPELAVSHYNDGMKQMNLQSLDNIKLLVPEQLMDTEYLHLVTQSWQTLFGFYIGIEEVPEDEFYQRIEDEEYALAVYPLSGDYNSPVSFIKKFASKNNNFGFSNPELDNILKEIDKCPDAASAAQKCLEAEKIIINEFLFIPVFYKSEYEIMSNGNHDIKYDPFTKQLLFRQAKYFE